VSKRERLLQVYKTTKKLPEELKSEPEIPNIASHLWAIFCELSSSRQVGFNPNPISYSEIQSYCILTQTHLDPIEVKLIKEMDNAFLTYDTNVKS